MVINQCFYVGQGFNPFQEKSAVRAVQGGPVREAVGKVPGCWESPLHDLFGSGEGMSGVWLEVCPAKKGG